MRRRRVLRSLTLLITVLGLLSTQWPWGVPIAKAQPIRYCDGTNGTHHFRLEGQKIVHWCGPLDRTRSTGIVVEAKNPKKVSGKKMAKPTFISPRGGRYVTNLNQYDQHLNFDLYEIDIPTRERKYFFAVHPETPKRIVGGLWTNDRNVYRDLGPVNDQLSTRDFDYFQVFGSYNESSSLFDQETNIIKSYLVAMANTESWSLVAQGSASSSRCSPEFYQSPAGTKKYFPSRGTLAIGGVHWDEGTQPGANISGILFGQSRAIRPSEPPAKINISGETATIKIGGASGPEPGWNDVQINRPAITFTYKYFMIARLVEFTTTRPSHSNYFYFESNETGDGCSLALSISDSLIRGQGEGPILVIQTTRVDGNRTGIFDALPQLASFKIDFDSYDAFIRKLYDGRGVNEIDSNDKKVQEFNKEDELRATRALNARNVESTGQEIAEDKCKDFGTVNFLFIVRLPTLAKAICEAGFFFAGWATVVASVTFNWLLQAAGLQ